MYRVTFISSIFAPDARKDEMLATLQLYLDTLVKANCIIMAHHSFPRLRDLRPAYEPHFTRLQDAIQLVQNRMGSLQDLAAYRTAELRKLGVDARAYFFSDEVPKGVKCMRTYRCVVRYPASTPRALMEPLAWANGNGVVEEGFDAYTNSKFPIIVAEYPLEMGFVSSLFAADGSNRTESHATLQLYLDALTAANRILRKGRTLPLLYEDGVRYQAEPAGQENWLDTLLVRKKKRADCEDLAADRTAELADLGALEPRSVFEFFQLPETLAQRYHCKTRFGLPMGGRAFAHRSAKMLPNGLLVEDPSKILGMHGAY